MVWNWLSARRRRAILEAPFPQEWVQFLRRNMAHYEQLDEDERQRLCDFAQVFIEEKTWRGCGGLELNDEIRVTIAGQACLLILELDHSLYENVDSILVYPSTVVPARAADPYFSRPQVANSAMPLLGEAHYRGPVILTWDSVKRGGRHPERGHNVVYHEFAHKLDMLDGAIDGMPPIADDEQYDEWVQICTRVYRQLHARLEAGQPSMLDAYAATNVAEFFAVVTENFFDEPLKLQDAHPDLYRVLGEFFRQDPAQRVLRTSSS